MAIDAYVVPNNASADAYKQKVAGSSPVHYQFLKGDKGDPGQAGDPGQPGVSPTISVQTITGGHEVSVTDANGTQTFDVMDGEQGSIGRTPEIFATAVTLAAGSNADANISGTIEQPLITFGIPRGADGSPGADGSDGTTFTPSVSVQGVLSWTNDGGKENPQSIDLVSAVIEALPSAVGVSF